MDDTLSRTAAELVSHGRGLLAADESIPTMTRRLRDVGLASTWQRRRRYREVLVTTPGLEEHVSGVILCDETLRQHTTDGRPFPAHLRRRGMLPGIKVDAGTTAMAGHPGEVVTEGLDGLRGRLEEYAGLGAAFAKWRAVLHVDATRPSTACTDVHAQALARYAALAQEAGLVPVVEPEVLMDGSHDAARCADVTAEVLRAVYDQLARHRVRLDATLLKPNMVLPGAGGPPAAPDPEVARQTLAVLRDTVPASVPGIVFLSGGQSEVQATSRLDALNRCGTQPWQLSFSFGRALQATALRTWAGREENVDEAQRALLHRARLNGAARAGRWEPSLEWPADRVGTPPARAGAGSSS